MKKRILSILLVAALAAGTLFGCGSVKEETNETKKKLLLLIFLSLRH